MSIAAIAHKAVATIAQMAERVHMGTHEVRDLNVVAYASAVMRRVIRAMHFYLVATAQRRLHRALDEMRDVGG